MQSIPSMYLDNLSILGDSSTQNVIDFLLIEADTIRAYKAHTHTPIFGGSAVRSAIGLADSIIEYADSTTDSVIL